MVRVKVSCAMTIAGSDSGGGAGIEADLKTFSALGVHGTCAVTAITAQNTRGVHEIFPIPASIVKKQIETVLSDIPAKTVKTGMLYSESVVSVIAEAIERYKLDAVVDPVFRAGSGDQLIRLKGKKALIDQLIPKAFLVTPNKQEAEDIVQTKIESLEDMENAAKTIAKKAGRAAVLVKGGHVEDTKNTVTDVLYYEGEAKIFTKPRLNISIHGGGCVFSAAITAYLARGHGLMEAVTKAEGFIQDAITFSLTVGKGRAPVNPMASLTNEAEKFMVLDNVAAAAKIVEDNSEIHRYIAEVGMQVGMALPQASTKWHVAAIEGRIVKAEDKAKPVGCAKFGASSHIASIILATMRNDPTKRGAVNLRYDEKLVETLQRLGYKIACFDRKQEPPKIKEAEGETLDWGINQAIRKTGKVPDVVYDLGDIGKEPMIRIIGYSATNAVEKALTAIQKIRK